MNKQIPEAVLRAEPALWLNPHYETASGVDAENLGIAEIDDAERRLRRFAPLIVKCFPETAASKGIIESELTPVPKMQRALGEKKGRIPGRLLVKLDSHLPIAGSVKARGGIYEVLKHTEELALEHGLLASEQEDYSVLASLEARAFFSRYSVQVGSTGNLGMSIGIMSAALGYHAVVHMSADARQWKKDLLRSRGVEVVEYAGDYSEAVRQGRSLSDSDPMSYFVDDENSRNLFFGYSVAAGRLAAQLTAQEIAVDEEHPLFVYLPCGVGGAPGGIAFGLKQVYGKNVHCFFVEPTQSPCMLLGMATGLNSGICVQDVGLSGKTHADGLAVGRPSGFVGGVMKNRLSGIFTVADAQLYDDMRLLLDTEEIFLEPSACAAFEGVRGWAERAEMVEYLHRHNLMDKMDNITHIAWATGGSLVPEVVREEYRVTRL